ncbi:MAG: site-specific integrase [Treponema sp.]|jgi:integrase|nr:site-specific integrase [Treponema sp.]
MSVKVREKRGKLYLDIYLGGKRAWEALGLALTGDKAQNKEIYRLAEICRSKRETQLLTGAWDIQDPVSSKKRLVAYLAEYAKTYASPGSVNSCIHHIKHFPSGETILLAQVTARWFDDFQKYLLNSANLSQMSARHYSKILRAALKKAVTANILTHNPAERVSSIGEPETDLVFLNAGELQRMADVRSEDYSRAEIRRAFLFSCHTGLRVSDLETITWSQIERNPLQIIKRQKKTKSAVFIPLNNSAWKLIDDGEEHAPGDKVFDLSAERRRRSYDYLKDWAAEAQVQKNIGWHTARRTFATLALENGVDVLTVARLLGHKSLAQVLKYAKVTDRLRREAVDALPETKL